MNDQQIKFPLKCGLCEIECQKSVPLIAMGPKAYCGNCLPKIIKEFYQIRLEEAEDRIRNGQNTI